LPGEGDGEQEEDGEGGEGVNVLQLPECGDFEALYCQPRTNFEKHKKFDLTTDQPFFGRCCWLLFFQSLISLFLNFVNSATPNQYNNKNGNPGIENKSKISNPFGMLN